MSRTVAVRRKLRLLLESRANNKLAGNVVDLCPVGALCSKDFLYKKRVWWLTSHDSVCVNCSTDAVLQSTKAKERYTEFGRERILKLKVHLCVMKAVLDGSTSIPKIV